MSWKALSDDTEPACKDTQFLNNALFISLLQEVFFSNIFLMIGNKKIRIFATP